MGLTPYGEENDTGKSMATQGLSLGESIRTHQFWFVFLMLFSYGFCTNSVNIHIVPNAIKLGFSATVAAAILAAIGGLQIAGRIGLGLAADKTGNRRIFIMGFSISALLLFWLPFINTTWGFFLFAVLFGFVQGGIASSQAPIVARLFGIKSHGLLFGCCGSGFTIGAAVGPYITGYLFDNYDNYTAAFLLIGIICLIALFLTLLLRPVRGSAYGTNRL